MSFAKFKWFVKIKIVHEINKCCARYKSRPLEFPYETTKDLRHKHICSKTKLHSKLKIKNCRIIFIIAYARLVLSVKLIF